jgi:single stranded DNA-binding protein
MFKTTAIGLSARASVRAFSTSPLRASFAKLQAIGRVTNDFEVQQSANGVPYIRYTLAVNNRDQQASFFNIAVFNPSAQDFMQKHIFKGSQVYIEADVSSRKYETPNGENRYTFDFVQRSISPISNFGEHYKQQHFEKQSQDAPAGAN